MNGHSKTFLIPTTGSTYRTSMLDITQSSSSWPTTSTTKYLTWNRILRKIHQLASIFVWEVFNWLWRDLPPMNKFSGFGQGLGSLLEALLQYRTRTSGRKNDLLEKRFAGAKEYSWAQNREMVRFSEEWWDILFEFGRDIGLMAAEQGPAVTGGSGLSSRPSSSSQDEQKASDVITTPAGPATPSSPSTPLGPVIDSSPASNAPASDGDIVDPAVSHGNTQPPSLTHAVSNSDVHDENTKQQSLFDSPATANPVTVTDEVPDSVANPTLAHSPPKFHASHPTDGKHAANRATIQISSPSPSSSPTPAPPSSEVGTGPPDTATSVVGDEQAWIKAGAPHVAIDVGSPTGSGRSEVTYTDDSGDGAPEGQARFEDVVVRIDSPN
ncbi:hypothetical protein BJ912DRAFT_255427 [Pholiota molesta]|nr:hypothetical protein BJ912DRAFT_255427 [Pholiota molesta]